jgi:hypothetical protein
MTLIPTDGPLKIDGFRFRNQHGQEVHLVGPIICCRSDSNPSSSKPDGWPLVNETNLDRFAAASANYTHIRLGPFVKAGEGATFVGYKMVGDKVDLTQWNPAFWDLVHATVQLAKDRGIYVEVSLIDCWTFKHDLSAWGPSHNIQNYSGGNCSVVGKAPHAKAKKWVRKVVDVLGEFDNVLWQDGNEVFDCHQNATAWTKGLKQFVRDREGEKGFRQHPFGTNSHQPELKTVGYEIYHAQVPTHSAGRPRIFNEYQTLTSANQWKQKALQAKTLESNFMLWRGNLNPAEWKKALGFIDDVL